MKEIKVSFLKTKHYQTFSLPTFKFVCEKENTLNPYPYFTIWFVIGNIELGLHIIGKGK